MVTKYAVIDFKNFLSIWSSNFKNASDNKEALRSFLNRLKSNYNIVRTAPAETDNNLRIARFKEKDLNVPFHVVIDHEINQISILY